MSQFWPPGAPRKFGTRDLHLLLGVSKYVSNRLARRPSSVQGTLLQTESCLKSRKWSPYKVKGPFSTPVCTKMQKNGPYSADQALSIASCNSHHALSAKAVHPPTSPCLTLSASAKPIFKTEDDYSHHS